MSKRLDAIEALIKSFKTKYSPEIFNIHPSLEFVHCSDYVASSNDASSPVNTSGGNGITAKVNRDVSQGEILLSIPDSSRLCTFNIPQNLQHMIFATSDKNKKKKLTLLNLLNEFEAEMPIIEQDLFKAGNLMIYIGPEEILTWVLIMYAMSHNYKLKMNNNGASSGIWAEQIDTWPSFDDIKASTPFLWDIEAIKDIFGTKNYIFTMFNFFQREIEFIFENLIYPTYKKYGIEEYFASPTDGIMEEEGMLTSKSNLWKNYAYAAAITYSRAHEGRGKGGEIVPLVELFNGLPSVGNGKNVEIISYMNRRSSVIMATRNIKKDEYLYIDYGELSPASYLQKYGMIPKELIHYHDMSDNIEIFLPADLLPPKSDVNRIKALKKGDYPVSQETCDKYPILLNTDAYNMYTEGCEPVNIISIRQFVLLGKILDDQQVLVNLQTGRIRGEYDKMQLFSYMKHIFEYNLQNLPGSTSKQDMQVATDPSTSSVKAALLMARVCQREMLLKWWYALHVYYRVEPPDKAVSCEWCGRKYPILKCSRCKSVSYCSQEHQKECWRYHKKKCN